GRNILAQGKRRRSISRATLGKDGAKRQPKLDGSPRFGEPLSPPEAAFAAANHAAGLSDGFINQPLPRVAAR
ncbi:MAG: hypothetical protein LBP75_06200, partial [Planctomycetota bacterium]|nr:hypothetical protein [Planctomycetota bacterium]